MDNIGEIGYILFFIFLIIINAIASAARRKKKRQQQEQQRQSPTQRTAPEQGTGERTKSLEEVMRELFGETAPAKPRPPAPAEPPVVTPAPGKEHVVRAPKREPERYVNPLQEVMMRNMTDAQLASKRKAEVEELQRIFSKHEHRMRKGMDLNLRQAVIHSEILMKPRWKEF